MADTRARVISGSVGCDTHRARIGVTGFCPAAPELGFRLQASAVAEPEPLTGVTRGTVGAGVARQEREFHRPEPTPDFLIERGGRGDGPPVDVGDDIPLGARIVAVVDAYRAMTTDRPFRRAQTHQEALRELRQCTGSQFDPAVVEAFEKVVCQDDEIGGLEEREASSSVA